MLYTPFLKLHLLLPVSSRHIGYLVGARLVLFPLSCSPIIFEKVTKAFPLIPSGSKMADQNVGLGSFSPSPPLAIRGLSVKVCPQAVSVERCGEMIMKMPQNGDHRLLVRKQ